MFGAGKAGKFPGQVSFHWILFRDYGMRGQIYGWNNIGMQYSRKQLSHLNSFLNIIKNTGLLLYKQTCKNMCINLRGQETWVQALVLPLCAWPASFSLSGPESFWLWSGWVAPDEPSGLSWKAYPFHFIHTLQDVKNYLRACNFWLQLS